MSLARDGVWKGGVWAPAVWAQDVWYEQPAPTPTPGGGSGGKQPRRRRGRIGVLPSPAPAPLVVIEGRMLVQEDGDTFSASGNAYESQAQIDARRNARTLAMLMLT